MTLIKFLRYIFAREILFSNETINVKFQWTCSVAASSGTEGLLAWNSSRTVKRALIYPLHPTDQWHGITAFHAEVSKYSITENILGKYLYLLVGHWLFIKGKTQKALTRAKDRKILLLCFMSYVKPSLSRKSINCTASNITLAGDSGYPNSL